MNNYALYYPTIEFADYEWLWRASLVWDRIYRIVPDGYEPQDCRNVCELTDSGEIGAKINPGEYAKEVGIEFLDHLTSGNWDAAALREDTINEFRQVHKEKVDYVLREMMITEGKVSQHGDWLNVPTHFAAHYMTYLANNIADRNNLQVLSDKPAAWAGSTYFRMDGDIQDYSGPEWPQHLATLVVRDFLPDLASSIKPAEILKFRERFREERTRFLNAIQHTALEISKCEDGSIIQDIINDLQVEINQALKEFRSSLSSLNIRTLTGMKSLAFPVATQAAAILAGTALSPSAMLSVYVGGAALGLISGLSSRNENRKKLLKENDYSYLMHMDREWNNVGYYREDYNYYLYRQLEEFVND